MTSQAAWESNKKNKIKWSNAVITPGTIFMEKLHNELKEYSRNNKITTTYSSYHECGEGEHKILQHIKQNKPSNSVIYGLDADLIFLSLASEIDNIFLTVFVNTTFPLGEECCVPSELAAHRFDLWAFPPIGYDRIPIC